ncbi:MAG: DNA integrity scanning diadenylate cyclase DisA [Actinomycetota bacterium]
MPQIDKQLDKDRKREELLRATLVAVAPGTLLREGLERIIRADTGALIVIGNGSDLEPIVSGGFRIDEGFTAQRLSELAKMDGAIVLSDDATRILRANVHLVPDPSIYTEESGTRHRTAERVAKQTPHAVVAVSHSMRIVTLYVDTVKRTLDDVSQIMARANQATQTLERYKMRLDEVSASLSALEVEDLATLRDAINSLQRAEMVRRIAQEVEVLLVELGTEGRLLRLQVEELVLGVESERTLVVRDYALPKRGRSIQAMLGDLAALTPEELLDPSLLAKAINHPTAPEALEQTVSPKGYRLLSKIPRLPESVTERIIAKFGRLQRVMTAGLEDLLSVEGVGAARATSIKEGLTRLAESSILERYT